MVAQQQMIPVGVHTLHTPKKKTPENRLRLPCSR